MSIKKTATTTCYIHRNKVQSPFLQSKYNVQKSIFWTTQLEISSHPIYTKSLTLEGKIHASSRNKTKTHS